MLASLDQTADVTTASYGMRLLCSYEPLSINVDFQDHTRFHLPFPFWIVISPAILAMPWIEEMTRVDYDHKCPEIGQ
jgi:hypothetical protein